MRNTKYRSAGPLLPRNPITRSCISTRDLGTAWANALASAILIVPSAVIPSENNYLINPLHPDVEKATIGHTREFHFDPRLLKK